MNAKKVAAALLTAVAVTLVAGGCSDNGETGQPTAPVGINNFAHPDNENTGSGGHEVSQVAWGEAVLVEDYDIMGDKTGNAATITVNAPEIREDGADDKPYSKVFVTVVGENGDYDASQLAYAHAYALLADGTKVEINWGVANDNALRGQVKPGEKVSGYIAFETDQPLQKVVARGMYLDEAEWSAP